MIVYKMGEHKLYFNRFRFHWYWAINHEPALQTINGKTFPGHSKLVAYDRAWTFRGAAKQALRELDKVR